MTPALHDESDVPQNGDIGQRITFAAIKSAYLPTPMVPTVSDQPMRSAATVVAARIRRAR
jgi:hypothetical protein